MTEPRLLWTFREGDKREGERERSLVVLGPGAGKGSDCNGHQLPLWGSGDVLTLDCGMVHKPVKILTVTELYN